MEVLLLPPFLLFFEQITPTPIPKRTIVPSLKCRVYASLLTSSLQGWEKASVALAVTHPYKHANGTKL